MNDWFYEYEERVGIMHHDGGHAEKLAESKAFHEVVAEMKKSGVNNAAVVLKSLIVKGFK
jgi:hypothetical protein